jgi:carbon monoxide dehydrogenase subunit G
VLIEESFQVKENIQKVWAFLRDVEKASNCIPGCEGIECLDQNNFLVTAKAKVAYLPVKFKVKVTVLEETPPFYLSSVSKGEEYSKAGYFSQKNTLRLTEISPQETEIYYRSEVSISGRIATFGQRIIMAKTREMADQFARNVKNAIEEIPVEKKISLWNRLGTWLQRVWQKFRSLFTKNR